MRLVIRKWRVPPPRSRLVCMCIVLAGCDSVAEPFDESAARAVTAVVLTDFLRRNPPSNWPAVFISDEFVEFSMDSLFLATLPDSPIPLQVAKRADVWVSYDIVRDGALLLEPSRPEVEGEGSVVQTLRFSSTSDFGGELRYRLRKVLGQWLIKDVRVIWIV